MNDIDEDLLFTLVKKGNFEGELPSPARTFTVENPLCGDEVTFFLELNSNDLVEKIRFQSKGCFICRASAAALAGRSEGKDKQEVSTFIEKFHTEFMTQEKSSDEAPEFQQLHELRQYPTRVKCVLLPFEALAKIIS